MPQFRPKTSNEGSEEQPKKLPSESDQRPELKSLPSPSSTPATDSARKIDVAFLVQVDEGELPIQRRVTGEELQAFLTSIDKDGLTLPNQKGFTWYPPHTIRKVTVVL